MANNFQVPIDLKNIYKFRNYSKSVIPVFKVRENNLSREKIQSPHKSVFLKSEKAKLRKIVKVHQSCVRFLKISKFRKYCVQVIEK